MTQETVFLAKLPSTLHIRSVIIGLLVQVYIFGAFRHIFWVEKNIVNIIIWFLITNMRKICFFVAKGTRKENQFLPLTWTHPGNCIYHFLVTGAKWTVREVKCPFAFE